MLKSFCFWGCVCLGRREYVELCCGAQILLFLGLCVFRSERIRRVVFKSFCFWGCVCLGRRGYVELCCVFKSFCFWGCVCLGRREYVELCCGVQILLFLGLCVFRSERIRRVVLRCSNPSVSGVVCV